MRKIQPILGWAIALACIAVPPALRAADSPSRPPPTAPGLIRDMRLKILAEQALKADSVLAPLKLKVEVRDGVVELRGAVPSGEAGRDAVAAVKAVKGIEDVWTNLTCKGFQITPTANEHKVAKPPSDPPPVNTRLALPEEVARIRQSEARFRAITVDIQDGNLVVHRRGVESRDATALAQILRRIPGVGEVLITND
jgi:hypothetical protein